MKDCSNIRSLRKKSKYCISNSLRDRVMVPFDEISTKRMSAHTNRKCQCHHVEVMTTIIPDTNTG